MIVIFSLSLSLFFVSIIATFFFIRWRSVSCYCLIWCVLIFIYFVSISGTSGSVQNSWSITRQVFFFKKKYLMQELIWFFFLFFQWYHTSTKYRLCTKISKIGFKIFRWNFANIHSVFPKLQISEVNPFYINYFASIMIKFYQNLKVDITTHTINTSADSTIFIIT